MKMSEIVGTTLQPFWAAEMDYRLEKAQRSYGAGGGRKRFRIRRRRTLKLPQQGARPIAVA